MISEPLFFLFDLSSSLYTYDNMKRLFPFCYCKLSPETPWELSSDSTSGSLGVEYTALFSFQ